MIEMKNLLIVFDYCNMDSFLGLDTIFVLSDKLNRNHLNHKDHEYEAFKFDIGKIPWILARDFYLNKQTDGRSKSYWMLAIARKYLTKWEIKE